MNKKELVEAISKAEKRGLTKACIDDTLNVITEVITAELSNGEQASVILPGLGAFVVKWKEARIGRNPATGKEVQIPAKNVVSFKVSKTLKDAVNQ